MPYGLDEWGRWEKSLNIRKPREPKPKTPLIQRFMDKIIVDGSHWMWQGAQTNGYGAMMVDAKTRYAHRVSYELFKGPIPSRHGVRSTCELRLCVYPLHLVVA